MDLELEKSRNSQVSLLMGALVVVLGIVILRNAWVGDDAYITFRTVDNFVNGYGLTWNVAERVQSFTHPLWVMILSALYYFTSEPYYTSIFLSLVLTLAAAIILIRKISCSVFSASLVIVMMISSKSFIDYSTSGLENPLTHLILVLFGFVYFSGSFNARKLLLLSFLAGLGVLNRMDTVLLYLPGLLYAGWQVRGRKALANGLIGFAPFLVWEIFSLLYYGFPFPNTYYAKLHTGISGLELVVQGFMYYLDSVNLDPLTMIVILGGLIAVWASRSRSKQALYAGVLLYLGYVLLIGGGFMSGRFFAAPFLLSVILLARLDLKLSTNIAWGLIIGVMVIGLSAPRPPVLISEDRGKDKETLVNKRGIADEQGYYFQAAGLLLDHRGSKGLLRRWISVAQKLKRGPTRVYECRAAGGIGYAVGPKIHLIDTQGLSDPLLARLPALDLDNWRIGHYVRAVPGGYAETLEYGKNVIASASLAEYYEHLSVLTKGPVFSWSRLVEIWNFNTGSYDYLLNDLWQGKVAWVNYTSFRQPVAPRSVWNATGNMILRRSQSLVVRLDRLCSNSEIEISVDHNDDYQILFMRGEAELASLLIESKGEAGMRIDTLSVPTAVIAEGYDRIKVTPVRGDSYYSIGHLRLIESDSRAVP